MHTMLCRQYCNVVEYWKRNGGGGDSVSGDSGDGVDRDSDGVSGDNGDGVDGDSDGVSGDNGDGVDGDSDGGC